MNITEIIDNHEKEMEKLEDSLIEFFQPLVDAFCEKHNAIFFAVNGDWYFHFGDIHSRPDEDYFRELDPDLINGMNYMYNTRNEVGSLLDCYPRVK